MKQRHKWVNGKFSRHGVGDITGTYSTYLRSKATQRGLEYSVSEEYLWNLFLSQNKKCALSGVDLNISHKINSSAHVDRANHTASLDRIDSNKGYVEGNVQWVHKIINIMKRHHTDEVFINWCTLVSQHANPDPSVVNVLNVTTKEQRLGSADTTNNLPTSAQHPAMDDDIV